MPDSLADLEVKSAQNSLADLEVKPRGNSLADLEVKPMVNSLADLEFRPRSNSGERIKSTLQYIKEHPFKTILQPIPETLGGRTPKEVIVKKAEQRLRPGLSKSDWWFNFIKDFNARNLGDIANIATTPASYIPLPIGKAIGKIPIAGTTLGKIAETIPVGRGFLGGVKELGRYEQTLRNMASRVPQTFSEQLGIQSPIQKITQALKEAKPIRGEQEALYSAERSIRAGAISKIGKQVPGEAGYYKQLGALKGELPKVQFGGIRDKVTQPDIDYLFNTVEKSPLSPFEKITTKNGLAKLLGEGGGRVPTGGELDLLSEVFPADFIKTVLGKRPLLQKLTQGVGEVLNVPRALMASFDMSAPLRQGVFMIGRVKQFTSAFGNMFKYFFSEKAYQGLMKEISSRPTYPLMKDSGLSLTNIGGSLTNREEVFMSQLAEKIPGVGHIVRASDRAYTGFLNKLRADVFDDLVKHATRNGLKIEGKLANDIASFVSNATGRGELGGIERAAVILNSTLFSPRLLMSRLNLLNPIYYIKLEPFVRKEALKSLITFAGTGMSILGLAKLGGADVGYDPRSADFGKIKLGNTRYDTWGGFQQYVRLAAQLLTGEMISSTTGVKTTLGEGYKPVTRLDILSRFLESKTNPVMSFATNLLRGQSNFGQKLDIPKEVGMRFVPMVVQDMYDLSQDKGLQGLGMAIPGIFGVGVQTYSPTAKEMVYSKNSVLAHYKEMLKEGRLKEAQDLYTKNKEILRIGSSLEPSQKIINAYNKTREAVSKNVLLSPQLKKEKIAEIDQKIKDVTVRMETRYKILLKQ